MKNKVYTIVLLFVVIFVGCAKNDELYFKNDLINLDHLDHLCQDIVMDGDTVSIVHIYAEYPDYDWVDAADEGIACLDDVARAAVVYLRYYELTGEPDALNRARKLLRFVMKMQCENGEFYNFIYANHTINKEYKTSIKSFDFWAARGYWALALAYRVFQKEDEGFASQVKDRFLRCKQPLRTLLKSYGEYDQVDDRRYPTWLINRYGSDATSEFLLGLVHFFQTEQDTELEEMAGQLIDGILAMQQQDDDPYSGAFLAWKGIWHAYANCQTQALSDLGQILHKPEWIDAARKEADLFYPELLNKGYLYAIMMTDPPEVWPFSQIAYGARPVINGLINLARVTGEEEYDRQAGMAAAWFFGKNAPQVVMYDKKTGRCFDGINDETTVNLNSGAESTIEALLALVEIASHPSAYASLNEWIQQHEHENKGN